VKLSLVKLCLAMARMVKTCLVSLLPLGLLACSGPSDVTVIHDVQLVHVGASPPELAPGQETSLTVTVADPTGGGMEILAWPCTDLGAGCAEDVGQPVADWVQLLQPQDEDATLRLTASEAWAEALSPDSGVADSGSLPFAPALDVWFLACRPGLCPAIDQARAAPAVGQAEDTALRAFLHDPTAAMAGLPLDGTSLGQRRVPIRLRAAGEAANENPELRLEDDRVLSLAPGGEQSLRFGLIDERPDGLQLDGLTSVGTLGPARTDAYDPSFTWFAGDQAATGRIYVVVRDGEGGSALWRADASVEP